MLFMKISNKDPFDYKLTIRALGVILTYMHSDLYEYMYYLTFKRSMKSYAKEFNDAWEQSIDHDEFFEGTTDRLVKNCHQAHGKIVECKQELILRFGINEVEDMEDREVMTEAQRFHPFQLLYKRSKSYKKLSNYYERTLAGFIECLFIYACSFTAEKYRVPLVLKRQFKQPSEDWFRLLNHDDSTVELLQVLITDLYQELCSLRLILKK
jgi:hypothetical protein